MRPSRTIPVVLFALLGVAMACGGIDDEEILCEEAVSHLEDCCQALEPRRFVCVNSSGCGQILSPDLTANASNCIRSRDCGDLVSSGACANLANESDLPYSPTQRDAYEKAACE